MAEPEDLPKADFARLTAITVESLVRMQIALDRQQKMAPKPEYSAIMAKMVEVCQNYNHIFFEHIEVFRKALDGQELTQ